MISIFGIVSIVIALISVVAIVLHNRVMNKRTPVDTYLEELEVLLRDRVEMLHGSAAPGSRLRSLCDQCTYLDFESILEALPDVNEALDDAKEAGDLIISGSFKDDFEAAAAENITFTAIDENAQKIQETITALNQSIENYNSFIASRLGVLMAQILGLEAEDPV